MEETRFIFGIWKANLIVLLIWEHLPLVQNCNVEGKSLQKSSILSRLAESIPFVLNFLRGHDVEAEKPKENNLTENILPPMLPSFADKNEVLEMMVPAEDTTVDFEIYSGKMMVMNESFDEKEYAVGEIEKVEHLDASGNTFEYIEGNFQGAQPSGEKSFISRNIGPGYKVVQERHEEEEECTKAGAKVVFQRALYNQLE